MAIFPNDIPNADQLAPAPRPGPFLADAAAGRLPQFSLLDPNYSTTSEENPQDIQVGERFVAQIAHAVIALAQLAPHGAVSSPTTSTAATTTTCRRRGRSSPTRSSRMTNPADAPGGYDRYGFRVPLIVVSPWARKNYVSRIVQDHTSITAFVERKWNLPAMTFRDANAHPMTDYFDFTRPAFATPPAIAAAPALHPGLVALQGRGLQPAATPRRELIAARA